MYHPVFLELTACLLIDFLLDIEFTFVQHRDIVCQNSHFNLGSLSPIKGWLPSLDEKSSYHHVIAWFDKIDKIIFNDYNS